VHSKFGHFPLYFALHNVQKHIAGFEVAVIELGSRVFNPLQCIVNFTGKIMDNCGVDWRGFFPMELMPLDQLIQTQW
jgi:hypothetical protein